MDFNKSALKLLILFHKRELIFSSKNVTLEQIYQSNEVYGDQVYS